MKPRSYNNGEIYEIVNLKTKESLYYGYSTAKLRDIKNKLNSISTILNIEILK